MIRLDWSVAPAVLGREFNYAMFSWRRITLAPILVVGGFAFEIYALLKRF